MPSRSQEFAFTRGEPVVTIHLATQCAQIEMVVDDVPAACGWFERVLGAQPIEQVERLAALRFVMADIDEAIANVVDLIDASAQPIQTQSPTP